MIVDRERADYMRTPGEHLSVEFGPFGFYVDTADGFTLVFQVECSGMVIGWSLSRER